MTTSPVILLHTVGGSHEQRHGEYLPCKLFK